MSAANQEQSEVDFGAEPEVAEGDALEKKYKEQMRQIVSQKIELPISTLPGMLKNQINLSPEFQRRNRWDRAQRSRFIESIIMNVPIPPVFLGEDEYGMYVVLDGRQRLTAIDEFLKNNFKLKGLEVWAELNGRSNSDLIKDGLDKAITRRFIPAVVVLKESSAQVKYDVFDRLNTGGVTATEMEIRNAVFPGPFNKMLHQLSSQKTFRRLWGIPTDDKALEGTHLYDTMRDLELVLRFFALREYPNMALRFLDYLSDFMEKRNQQYKGQPALAEKDKEAFTNAVSNSWKVFGEDAFRRPLPDGKLSSKSAPLADAVMVGLADIAPAALTGNRPGAIKDAITGLASSDEAFILSITKGTNGKGAIQTRIERVKAAIAAIVA
jgi:hypothetical protein